MAKIEDYRSPVNRQELGYELPVAAYMRAQDRIKVCHDQRRETRKRNGLVGGFDMAAHQREMRDYDISRNYTHHFTDMRGVQTVKRASAVVRKD